MVNEESVLNFIENYEKDLESGITPDTIRKDRYLLCCLIVEMRDLKEKIDLIVPKTNKKGV